MPPPIRPKPLIHHEAKLVRMVQELELEGPKMDRIVAAIHVVLANIRDARVLANGPEPSRNDT